MAYFTGKGYSPSTLTDITGKALLQYQGPNDKQPYLLSDRVCPTFDFTIAQPLTLNQVYNTRMDLATSAAIKKIMGGGTGDELDHKVPLELGGANSPANLWIEPHVPGTANTPTDPMENQLAADVQAGKISLLDAWRQMFKDKGFTLGEDLTTGTTFTFSSMLLSAFKGMYDAATGKAKQELGVDDANMKAQMESDLAKLKQNPTNSLLLTNLFQVNINYVAKRLNIPPSDATSTVVSYITNYAQSQKTDPKSLYANVNANLQNILNEGGALPNIFGVPSAALGKMATLLTETSGAFVSIGVVLGIIALATVGWEFGAAITSIGELGTFLGVVTGSTFGRIAIGAVALGEAINLIGIGLNMSVKTTYDNGYLLPTQNIGAIKDALAIEKTLGMGSGSTSPSGGTSSNSSVGSGYSGSSVSGTGVHVSVVSGGVLGSPATFTPVTSDIFENITDLQAATEENLAKYIGGLAGQLIYELRLVSHITLADGTMRIGTTQTIIKGYTKGSKKTASHPEYKKVTNKFIVADIKYKTLAGVWKKLDEIVVGAVDETAFKPTAQELAGLGDAIGTYLVANHLGGVTTINLPATGSTAPVSTSTPQSTVPTETPSVASASLTAAFQPTTPAETAAIANAVAQIPTVVAPVAAPAPVSQPVPQTDVSALRYGGPSIYTQLVQAGAPPATALAVAQEFNTSTPSVAAQQAFNSLLTTLQNPAQAPAPVAAPATKPKYCLVGDLYDYWNAKGLPHPGVVANGLKYQALGLGSASVFVGSVGQNTRLLQALQAADGC